MNGGINPQAVMVFAMIVGLTLALSFYLGSKAKSAKGFFAAGGDIPWFINGIAFAGDYLSAASFLGICGMIAFYGYDGFLYSIGYLAGWVGRATQTAWKVHVCRCIGCQIRQSWDHRRCRPFYTRRIPLLSDPPNGRRRSSRQATLGPAALGRSDYGGHRGDHHRDDRWYGQHHICAIPQGSAARILQHHSHCPDLAERPGSHSER